MSTNLNYKQVANITRRTWDIAAYEKRAKERAKKEESGGGGGSTNASGTGGSGASGVTSGNDAEPERQEFVAAPEGSAVSHLADRAYLKARKSRVDGLDSKVGSVEVINPDAVATSKSISGAEDLFQDQPKAVIKSGVGWHCKVCDCFLKDSMTYLDHINGRKHQRALGYSMKVERSTENQVSDKLAQLAQLKQKSKTQKQKQWTMKGMDGGGGDDVEDSKKAPSSKAKSSSYDDPTEEEEEDLYHTLVKSKDEELRRKKEERKRERKERKKLKKKLEQAQQGPEEEEEEKEEDGNGDGDEQKQAEDGGKEEEDGRQDEEAEEDGGGGGIDPDIAAMMGFSGFGGGNKNT
mmetsp:Transcript_4822/g.12277  ORF Transcript_4822/g.12277 Transcript_4822/m.12277 type:complete len:350 (+) Transcript_4822:143-1192(+)|eukprot:CAMPEP_0113458824 /NCGR_PEP_ID=MMETSP0014_2-20120614/10123_1 /TAXON_ID=2857 /ORGANISM="Nitzschia sp." /LENGTH=349 /DNA_ID=CAMNT_0000350363 /DNA_START=321 /DNA_END=1370 /DNA_ORIENTATION=+ /assembly_acc=CAM_ASM_000159